MNTINKNTTKDLSSSRPPSIRNSKW